MRPPAFAFADGVVTLALRLLARWQVEGRENVPRQGPLLVVANHTHYLDPPLLCASVRRQVLFLAKRELITEMRGWRRWCVIHYGLIPMDRRGLDREALRRAAEHVVAGGALGLLPEGTRSRSGLLQRAQPGASLVALSARVPILPVGISGLGGLRVGRDLWRRPRIHVRIGRPFLLPFEPSRDRTTLTAASDYMMERIAALLPEAQRGYYSQARAPAGDEHGEGI
ncbi:MAG: 1-acyl-sn-glycerol-3-phosphate acyltransferase [Chloroflexi bacterium]|nr:1-acyl-sn-glycerol-3-phosphate acyltransferase [Chloroflexota bacterium]